MLQAKPEQARGFYWKVAMSALVAGALSACASGTLPPASTADQSIGSMQSYKLGAGDKLRVITFGHEDLSKEFLVSDSGMISFPLVGQVKAAGLTLDQFQGNLATALKNGGFVVNPNVSVEVIEYRPFYILGEVQKPGAYPYQAGLTALNAIATAGGLTYRANKRKLFVRRADSTQEVEIAVTAATPVFPGDTVRIGERVF
ncbi:MAG: polysaccharide biosynthesis protein [Sphingobium sp.]|jgi:polysaccharide export outer membrane protein|nr:MAG: polysaccharide biosynthesis protein [Sphingobium sp.]